MQINFLFSGQGSQYYGMANRLFDRNLFFKKKLQKMDEMFGDYLGVSVLNEVFSSKKKSEVFDDITYTHSSIYMVENTLADMLKEYGIVPDCVMGSSLGEMAALTTAGCISEESAVEYLCRQISILKQDGEQGAMISVLDSPEIFKRYAELYNYSYMTSINGKRHFVLSCSERNRIQICQFLKDYKILHQQLPVKYPFHTELVNNIKEECQGFFTNRMIKKPAMKYISTMEHENIIEGNANYIPEIIREPMDIQKAFLKLEDVENAMTIDLSPSATMKAIFRQVWYRDTGVKEKKEVCYGIISPFLKEDEAVKKIIQKYESIKKEGEVLKKMNAYVFSGQGSQKKGMGKELFDEFEEYTRIADEVLGYSIRELCVEDPEEKLGITEYTQPALYVVGALSYLKKIKETGKKPDYVLGHSLGEYNALMAAGVFGFKTGLQLVKMRGRLMYQAGDGGMAAVLGLREEEVLKIIKDRHLDDLDISNLNTPRQIAIGGPNESIEAAKEVFEQNGARRYVILNVSGAFHSRYMESAAVEFTDFIKKQQLNVPQIQVISNYTARPYQKFEIEENLTKQIAHTVKWIESIEYLMGKGVTEFEEIGPGNVTIGMVKTIQRDGEPLYVNEDEEIELRRMHLENIKVKEAAESVKEAKIEEHIEKCNTIMEVEEKTILDKQKMSQIGSRSFMERYHISYAYVAGGMENGISSVDLVSDMSKHNLLSFLGTKNLDTEVIHREILDLKRTLGDRENYGINIIPTTQEEDIVTLCIQNNIRVLECSSYIDVSEQLIRYKAKGIVFSEDGYKLENRIMVKLNHPEVLKNFLHPASRQLLEKMCSEQTITRQEAEILEQIPVADDICLISGTPQDSNQIPMYALLPTMRKLKADIIKQYQYIEPVHVGVAGGISTPKAIKTVMLLGADFVLTGSVNQCTVEANTSDLVKDMLEKAQIQDTAIIPMSDFMKFGEKIQILRRGTLFHARAIKLNHLYCSYESLDEMKKETIEYLETRYFKCKITDICNKIRLKTEENMEHEYNKKTELSKIFQYYYTKSFKKALEGDSKEKADFFIYCSSAMGAFNEAVKGTKLEKWKNRSVHKIAQWLMEEAEKC